jgi:hypothetical protein
MLNISQRKWVEVIFRVHIICTLVKKDLSHGTTFENLKPSLRERGRKSIVVKERKDE